MTEKRTGRPPLGTGGHKVTLRESNKGSWRLFIGKELWRAVGSPARVELARRGNALRIAPTTSEEPGSYAIVGPATGGAPAISIGINICREELRIFAPATYEQCHVRRGEIVVFV